MNLTDERPTEELICALLDELRSTPENLFTPNTPVQEGEQVVGTVPPGDLRKLFCLQRHYAREQARCEAELPFVNQDDFAAAAQLRNQMVLRVQLLHLMMWWALRSKFDLWDACNTGMRRDWVLIKRSHEGHDELTSFFLSLGGQP